MTPETAEYRRFLELASFYQQGRLPPEDQEWMAAYLRRYPAAQAEFHIDTVVRAALKHLEPPHPESVALERFMARWQQVRPASESAVPDPQLQGLRRWLQTSWRIPALAAVAAAVLQLLQLGYIGVAMLSPATMASRGLVAAALCDEQPLLRLLLKPDARWEDVALLIRSQDATLRQGPGEAGELWLSVRDRNALAAARETLAVHPLVESAAIVPVPKERACKS